MVPVAICFVILYIKMALHSAYFFCIFDHFETNKQTIVTIN